MSVVAAFYLCPDSLKVQVVLHVPITIVLVLQLIYHRVTPPFCVEFTQITPVVQLIPVSLVLRFYRWVVDILFLLVHSLATEVHVTHLLTVLLIQLPGMRLF